MSDILQAAQGIKDTERYLNFLFEGARPESQMILCRIKSEEELQHSNAKMELKPFFSMSIPKVVQYIAENTNKRIANFYCQIGITEQGKFSRGNRSKENEITQVPAFYVDLDYGLSGIAHKKKNLPPYKMAVLNMIDRVFLKPSMIVHSGNGVHAYWILDHPIDIPEHMPTENAKNINRMIHNLFAIDSKKNKWHIDSVFDLTRILRIPGTINRKTDGSSTKEIIATIEEDNNIKYSVEEIMAEIKIRNLEHGPAITTEMAIDKRNAMLPYAGINDDVDAISAGKNSKVLSSTTFELDNQIIILDASVVVPVDSINDLLSINPNMISMLRGKWNRKIYATTSECDYALAKAAIDACFSNQMIANLLIFFRRINTLSLEKPMRPSYVLNTILNARASILKKKLTEQAGDFLNKSSDPNFQSNQLEDVDIDNHRENISKTIGVQVLQLIKHTGDDPSYTLKTALGDVKLPGISEITSKTKFKNRLAACINKVIELPKDWNKFANMLLSIVIEDISDNTATAIELMKIYLKEYFAEALIHHMEFEKSKTGKTIAAQQASQQAQNAQSLSGAIADRAAYFLDDDFDRMYFFLDKFYAWMKDMRRADFKLNEVRINLRALGCAEIPEPGGLLNRNVWVYVSYESSLTGSIMSMYEKSRVKQADGITKSEIEAMYN